MASRRFARQDRAFHRLDGDRVQRLFLVLLEVPRYAGDRPAGADARDENVDLAVGVVPDFRARSF